MARRTPPATAPDGEKVSSDSFPITFDTEKGRIFMQGLPVWFMSPQYYADMQVQLETLMGKASRGILYRAAEHAGVRIATLLGPGIGPETDDMARVSLLLRVAEVMPSAGHGRMTFVVGDLKDADITWTLPYSYIAELSEKTSHPVCHFYAGYIGGIASVVFGRNVVCEEVECRVMSAKACVFKTRAT